jgi:hypothetical protein
MRNPDTLPQSSAQPRVTLVMTVRERFRLTLRSIESILANTAIPYRFIFSHGTLPKWLDEGLAALEQAGKLERRVFPQLHWPQHLRKAVLDEVDTEFVAFIDNDILVSPDWMQRLIETADATGAGIVGPVYLWGDGNSPPKVHMAGGTLLEEKVEGGPRVLKEIHDHMDADPAVVIASITRKQCDMVEFHCMLVRTELARAEGVFDPDIIAVHEHINTCLSITKQGASVVLEPSVQVTYLAYADQILEDLHLMRTRWDSPAVESSIAAFSHKWDVETGDRSWGGVRSYAADLRRRHDPLRPGALGDKHRLQPIARDDLPQTRAALLDLARARGYDNAAQAMIARTCTLAALLFDGGYRPCGRPFLNHVIGTAGVLVYYDFCLECVLEALLHAAYTHPRFPLAQIQGLIRQVHPTLEARVRDNTQRRGKANTLPILSCTTRDVEVASIEAANEIDMRLSGEYAYSGRPPEVGLEAAQRLAQFLVEIGVPGMQRALFDALAMPQQVPRELVTHNNYSYRIGAGGKLVPMIASQ